MKTIVFEHQNDPTCWNVTDGCGVIKFASSLDARMAESLFNEMAAEISQLRGSVLTREQATEELKGEIQKDGGLYNGGHYMAWTPGDKTITMDDSFTAEELLAIAWWMQNSSSSSNDASDK